MPSSADVQPLAARAETGESHLLEALLWRELRARPGGLRFSRRRVTGKYVHDFYCPDARLAIEVEGMGATEERASDEHARNDWLARAGIVTMRVSARHVLEESRLAAGEIVSRAKGLLPQSHPLR